MMFASNGYVPVGRKAPEENALDSEEEEPDEEEVREYAETIGIDPDAEPDLMWIARMGITAPLPSDEWAPCETANGQLYFYNFKTAESSWEHPSDEKYRKTVIEERQKRASAAPKKPAQAVAPLKQTKPATALAPLAPLSKPQGRGALAPIGAAAGPSNPVQSKSPAKPALTPLERPKTSHGAGGRQQTPNAQSITPKTGTATKETEVGGGLSKSVKPIEGGGSKFLKSKKQPTTNSSAAQSSNNSVLGMTVGSGTSLDILSLSPPAERAVVDSKTVPPVVTAATSAKSNAKAAGKKATTDNATAGSNKLQQKKQQQQQPPASQQTSDNGSPEVLSSTSKSLVSGRTTVLKNGDQHSPSNSPKSAKVNEQHDPNTPPQSPPLPPMDNKDTLKVKQEATREAELQLRKELDQLKKENERKLQDAKKRHQETLEKELTEHESKLRKQLEDAKQKQMEKLKKEFEAQKSAEMDAIKKAFEAEKNETTARYDSELRDLNADYEQQLNKRRLEWKNQLSEDERNKKRRSSKSDDSLSERKETIECSDKATNTIATSTVDRAVGDELFRPIINPSVFSQTVQTDVSDEDKLQAVDMQTANSAAVTAVTPVTETQLDQLTSAMVTMQAKIDQLVGKDAESALPVNQPVQRRVKHHRRRQSVHASSSSSVSSPNEYELIEDVQLKRRSVTAEDGVDDVVTRAKQYLDRERQRQQELSTSVLSEGVRRRKTVVAHGGGGASADVSRRLAHSISLLATELDAVTRTKTETTTDVDRLLNLDLDALIDSKWAQFNGVGPSGRIPNVRAPFSVPKHSQFELELADLKRWLNNFQSDVLK